LHLHEDLEVMQRSIRYTSVTETDTSESPMTYLTGSFELFDWRYASKILTKSSETTSPRSSSLRKQTKCVGSGYRSKRLVSRAPSSSVFFRSSGVSRSNGSGRLGLECRVNSLRGTWIGQAYLEMRRTVPSKEILQYCGCPCCMSSQKRATAFDPSTIFPHVKSKPCTDSFNTGSAAFCVPK